MSSRKKNFIVQASILGIAGLIVRMIGLLYRSPLTHIIGDEGNGYYGQAYNIYTIILLISSYSIPLAISKVVSAKLAFKEYRNAHRVFLCALFYVAVIGSIASLFLYFGAPFLVDENAVIVLRVFSPTIFFYGILGVLRGYFQAHGTMVQTSISQIIEQLLNALVSIGSAYFFTQYCISNAMADKAPIWGAAGSAIGTGAGVFIGLLFMLLVYYVNRPFIRGRVRKDPHETLEPYSDIFKTLLLMVTPVIFSTFIYNCSTAIDMKLYYNISYKLKDWTEAFANTQYGIFSTKFIVLRDVPVALASSISTAMIPGISESFATGNVEATSNKVQQAVRFTMLIAIPAAVGMSAVSDGIVSVLFPQRESLRTAVSLLQYGTISIIFYSLSTVTNGVLQGIGKVNIPVKNAVLALIIHLCVLTPLLCFTKLDLYALVIGTAVYSLIMCILNGLAVKKHLNYRQDIKKTFVLPGICALIMGGAAWASYYGVYLYLYSKFLGLLVSIPFSAFVYFILLLKLKAVTEDDLKRFPKGNLLAGIARKLHLI